jgi:hypothetical protein
MNHNRVVDDVNGDSKRPGGYLRVKRGGDSGGAVFQLAQRMLYLIDGCVPVEFPSGQLLVDRRVAAACNRDEKSPSVRLKRDTRVTILAEARPQGCG